jgi:Sec-independent protein translocase protein TatA
MTKILFILLILIVLFGLIALRYRRQIQTALYFWRMVRKMRQMGKAEPEKKIEKQATPKDAQLVRCAKCNTWIPQTKALNLRSKIFYCSANCMENAVVK